MLAKPAVTCVSILSAAFLLFLTGNSIADPIGSIKSLKKYKQISIKEAPNLSSKTHSSKNKNLKSTDNDDTSDNPGISRSQFTTAVVNREPTDNVVMLTNNSDMVYYFTELSNLAGQRIIHRWQYQGKLMAEVKFDVKSDRWRVFSSKKIRPDWTGEWSVELVDEDGNSLTTNKLEVISANSN